MREASNFRVMPTEARSARRGGVTIFNRKAEHFAVEELCLHGPNVVSFQLVMGRRQWHVVGCYIYPSDASIIEDVAAAIRSQPYGDELLVAGDINANLEYPEGTLWLEALVDKLTASCLIDMCLHFLPQCNPWLKYRCTWRIQRYGQEVRSWTEYIIGTDCRLFQDVDVRYMRHHSDHYMVLSCLRADPAKELTVYLCKARRFPLRPLYSDLASDPDEIFSEIKTQIPKPHLRERVRQDWISDDTWESIDARVTARREGYQRTVRKLSRHIRVVLRTDWKRRAEEAFIINKSDLTSYPPPIGEAWVQKWGWYKDAVDSPPPPRRVYTWRP